MSAQLSLAAQQGDAAAVERLLGECTQDEANHADEKQCTPLHWACSCDEPAAVRLLMADIRVNVDARSRHGMTVVHHASAASALRVLPLLLDGAASHLVDAPNEWGEVPLHVAATAGHAGVVAVLLGHGATTEAVDRWGRTPSRVATQQGLVPTALGLPMAQPEAVGGACGVGGTGGAGGAGGAADVQLQPERRAMQEEFMLMQLARQRNAPDTTQVQVKHMFAPQGPTPPPPPPAPLPPLAAAAAASAENAPPADELQRAVARRAAARAVEGAVAETAASAATAAATAAPPQRGRSPPHPQSSQPASAQSKLPALSKLVEYPGDPAEVARLLETGEVNPSGADLFGLTALHKFSSWDKLDLLDLLLPHLDAEQCNARAGPVKLTALHVCVDMGALRATQRLLKEPHVDARALDGRGRTAKQVASSAGHTHIAALLP